MKSREPRRRPHANSAARRSTATTLGVAAGAAVAALGVTLSATALVSGVQLDLLDAAEVVRAPEAHPVAHAPHRRQSHTTAPHLEPVQLGQDVTVQLTGQRMGFTAGTITATQGLSMPVQLELFA